MKIKEYMRLGKISIKSRKKSTKNTVIGICFGLIMIVPVLFFAMSFYIGLTSNLNNIQTVSAFHVTTRNDYDSAPKSVESSANTYENFTILDNKSLKDIVGSENVSEFIKSEYYNVDGLIDKGGEPVFALTVSGENDTKNYLPKKRDNNGNPYNGQPTKTDFLKIIHMPESGKYLLDSEISDFNKQYGSSIFVNGNGFTKETLGKTEIIVSEDFCKTLVESGTSTAMSPADIIGKKMTFSYTFNQNIYSGNIEYRILDLGQVENAPNPTTTTIKYIQDFTVVGVVNSNYYKLPSNLGEAHIWVSSKSVYDDEFASLAPSVSVVIQEAGEGGNSQKKAYYKVNFNTKIKQSEEIAKSKGLMIPVYGILGFNNYSASWGDFPQSLNYMTEESNLVIPPIDTKIQCNNFEDAQKLSKRIDAKLTEIMPSRAGYGGLPRIYANELFVNFSNVSMIGGYVMIVFSIFGGIIFFATMLNLYNSVNYSVQVRKNYMGVMRAIGAKSSMIPKLYFWEILLIFLRALPWVLIISGLLSFGIKLLIDMGFSYISGTLGMTISLNFAYFFVSLGIIIVLVFAIALLFSQIAASYAARRPILDVLSDDKG